MKIRIKIVKSTEKIPGGLGAKLTGSMEEKHQQIADEHGVPVEEIEAELEKGMEVEMEHTTDEDMAHEIAMDHLLEDPRYYTKLDTIEEKKGKKRKVALKKRRKKKKKKKGKKDACYHKVRSRYDVWPSAYASGALVKCRKVGAKNWGNKSEGLSEEFEKHDMFDPKTGEKQVANVEQDHKDMAKKGFVHVDPKKIEKVLRDEGGAAGLDPFLKELGDNMEDEILKALEAMPNVGQHDDGDYILSDDEEIDVVKEVKNCGCGQKPCKTYGRQ